MSCNSYTLKGIELGCKDHMGGIKCVWLIDESNLDSITLNEAVKGDDGVITKEANVEIASITLGASASFKPYKFRKGTSNMVSTATSDEANGTFSVQTDIALQFNKMETAKRTEIMAMCLGNMKGVVKDNNNKYWFVGFDQPISASAASGETGTAFGDFGGYKVTLTDNSKEMPYEIPASVAEELAGIKGTF